MGNVLSEYLRIGIFIIYQNVTILLQNLNDKVVRISNITSMLFLKQSVKVIYLLRFDK